MLQPFTQHCLAYLLIVALFLQSCAPNYFIGNTPGDRKYITNPTIRGKETKSEQQDLLLVLQQETINSASYPNDLKNR
jgi:hypothetical protein